jgi:hypothetical protein
MIIEVNGQQVEVDDSFATLSPEKQQETLQYITNAMSPQAAPEADQANVLYGAGIGLLGGQAAGPAINKGMEAMRSGAPSAAAAPGTPGGASPGQKFAAKTGYGSGTGYTVEEVVEHKKAQEKPIGKGKITSKIASNSPMNVDRMLQLEAAKKAEDARRAAALAPTGMMAKLPGPVQAAGRFIGGAAQSGVTPYLGRAVAGAGAGFQGTDAYNRFQQGDYPGAAISGLGALGSAASFIPTPVTRIGGPAIGVGAEMLNQYLDSLKKKVEGMDQPAAAPAPAQGPLSQPELQGMAEGGGVKLPGKLGKLKNVGEAITSAAFRASPEQTVTNPLRNAFPGIYKRPDVIAKEAAERVAPESPALKQLFGVTRDDLYEMGKGRVGNVPGLLPGAAANPKGSRAAADVMNPRNEQRLLDVLSESEKYPQLVRGMDPWYIMDPAYQRLEQLVGPVEAVKRYKQLNTLTGMASPGSDVLTEMNRGTAANYLATQGRFGDFVDYAGKPMSARGSDFPDDLRSVMGHPYHRTAQAIPMQQYLDTGAVQMSSPKVPAYIQASSVPQVGFQTDLPVGDAHWSRAVGLADTRGAATRKGQSVVPGASVSNPEMSTLAPWWKDKIAAQVGLESVPAQARAWGAFSPQTGVESPIGAPKLELLSMKIMEAANRYGVSPEQARDMILKGEGYAGKKEGGLV